MILGRLVTAVAFWLATLLPFLYLPIFAVGIDSMARLSTVLALLAINVVALIVGHDYAERQSA